MGAFAGCIRSWAPLCRRQTPYRRSPRDAHRENHQPSTKKMYRSMSFAALDLKFLIVIDNYASYKSGKPCDLFTTFSFIIPIFH